MGGYIKSKGRGKARFAGIPFSVLDSPQGKALTPYEVKLLICLLYQGNGRNNGMLSPCHSLLKEHGFAKGTLHRTKSSLIEKGFLVVTRQGIKKRGRPTLVAITWNGIDEPVSGVIYDDGIKPDETPLNYWKNQKHRQF